jgi:uncharacterized protein
MEKKFIKAAWAVDLAEMKRLVEQEGVNVNVVGNKGWTALLVACFRDRLDMFQMLLDMGADVNVTVNGGDSPLMVASSYEHVEIMKLLLVKTDAKVNQQDGDGCTTLHYAIAEDKLQAAELLLDYGADGLILNNRDEMPLDTISSENSDGGKIKDRLVMILFKKVHQLRQQVQTCKNLTIATAFGGTSSSSSPTTTLQNNTTTSNATTTDNNNNNSKLLDEMSKKIDAVMQENQAMSQKLDAVMRENQAMCQKLDAVMMRENGQFRMDQDDAMSKEKLDSSVVVVSSEKRE